MLTPVHSLVQELTISLSFANDTILIEVSDRRGSVFDEAYTEFVSSAPQHFRAINPSFAGDVQFNGVDYWRINEAGLIQEMTVLWRPLPAVVAVQNKLAGADGEPG